jgi:DNA-directed RNA polymerase subunit RPC12/RpoP
MEQTGNIPPRYALRLRDLRHWHRITVTCPACGHKGPVAATALGHGQPDYTRLIDLERRLRCRSCGNRGDNRILVTLAPRE